MSAVRLFQLQSAGLTRIRPMAARWQYSAEELVEALAAAAVDPEGWLSWTERDARDFGDCVTPEEFAAQYARLHRYADGHYVGVESPRDLPGHYVNSVAI